METDRRYFVEGLFIIGLSVVAAFFFVWLGSAGQRDDVLYRIRFAESVAGLAQGDPVKYRGVDVGSVKRLAIDANDTRLVQVDVMLQKDAPIKTDTHATLERKGLTGGVFIELSGGAAGTARLSDATPPGHVPEIPSEMSRLGSVLEQLPKVIERFAEIEGRLPKVIDKFSAIENKTTKVLDEVGEVTKKVKEDPSLLLRRPKKDKAVDENKP